MTDYSDSTHPDGGPTDEDVGLDVDDCARLIAELLEAHEGGLTHEQINEALEAFNNEYVDMIVSCAMWEAWRHHQVRFDYIDGEIMVTAS